MNQTDSVMDDSWMKKKLSDGQSLTLYKVEETKGDKYEYQTKIEKKYLYDENNVLFCFGKRGGNIVATAHK